MFFLFRSLFELFFAVAAIRSLLRFASRLWMGFQSRPPVRPATSGASEAPPQSTLLHQDPVCGTYVATDTSLKQVVSGKVLHFCSAECRDRYSAG